jgi:hypothetical protein
MRTDVSFLAAFSVVLCLAAPAGAQPTTLTRLQMEEFLRTAKILDKKQTSVGITGSMRARMSDGILTHDAHIQCIDMAKSSFQTPSGTELNFKDSWKYNIAAYRIDRLLDLNMVPVSVERNVPGMGTAAVTWWVDDVLMDEVTRHKKKVDPPDQDLWNRQMYVVRVFDQLIYNTDRNLQNLLFTKDWRIWMIDHTRAFRMHTALKDQKNLVRCDRRLLEALRQLDALTIEKELRAYLSAPEIKGLMARRDLIVRFFEQQVAKRGEKAVLYDIPVEPR